MLAAFRVECGVCQHPYSGEIYHAFYIKTIKAICKTATGHFIASVK
jgi:hypothetical protein